MAHLAWLSGRLPAHQVDFLISLLTAKERFYHGIDHIDTLWKRHLDHGGSYQDDIIALAIAYHDAIYDASRKDNELRSNELWLEHALEAGHPPESVKAVSEAIMATAEHPLQRPAPPHVLWMVDLDLMGLASDRDDFEADSVAVWREMPWLTAEQYYAGRKAFFAGLLKAPVLYRTHKLHELYEAKARANLEAAIGVAA